MEQTRGECSGERWCPVHGWAGTNGAKLAPPDFITVPFMPLDPAYVPGRLEVPHHRGCPGWRLWRSRPRGLRRAILAQRVALVDAVEDQDMASCTLAAFLWRNRESLRGEDRAAFLLAMLTDGQAAWDYAVARWAEEGARPC